MAGKMQFCFKRYEKKYTLTAYQLAQMMAGIRGRMCADEFGRYRPLYYLQHSHAAVRRSCL